MKILLANSSLVLKKFFFFKEHLLLNMTTPGQYPGITFHFPISHILLPLTSSPKFLLTAYSLRDIS